MEMLVQSSTQMNPDALDPEERGRLSHYISAKANSQQVQRKKINTLSLSYQECRGHCTLGRPFAEKYSSFQPSAVVPLISSKP